MADLVLERSRAGDLLLDLLLDFLPFLAGDSLLSSSLSLSFLGGDLTLLDRLLDLLGDFDPPRFPFPFSGDRDFDRDLDLDFDRDLDRDFDRDLDRDLDRLRDFLSLEVRRRDRLRDRERRRRGDRLRDLSSLNLSRFPWSSLPSSSSSARSIPSRDSNSQ